MTTLEQPQTLPAPRRRPWGLTAALVVVLALITLLAYALSARDRSQVLEGPAPDFTLQTFDGETIQLSELRGTPVILNFWASWCVECDKEMALLEDSSQRYQGKVLFLGIDYLDTEPKALAYLEQYGISYLNGPDLGGRISNAYNIKGVPETFFIARDGTIQGLKIGPLTEAELEGWIATLLASPDPSAGGSAN